MGRREQVAKEVGDKMGDSYCMNARSRLMTKVEETAKAKKLRSAIPYLLQAVGDMLEQVDELGLIELERNYGTKKD